MLETEVASAAKRMRAAAVRASEAVQVRSLFVMSTAVQILCLSTFVVRDQLTRQCKISDNKVKVKGTAQLWS